MYLVAGLGNPGKEYEHTRHNIGFMVIDAIVDHLGVPARNEKKALVYKCKWDDKDILFVKPQTYMNLSGESIIPLMSYYKVPQENLLIIHDDLDMDFPQIKLQKSRGHGGQNGIRNIHQLLGSNEYARLKLGIGRPPHPKMDVSAWVLSKFSKQEEDEVIDLVERAANAVESFVFDGFLKASDQFNRKIKK